MARKRKAEEHENHERWLVSYADFITLLFAFFVVMYSISSVNEGKYRVLSSTMASAFASSEKSINPIQYGKKLRDPIIQHKSIQSAQDRKKKVGVEHEIMPTPKEVAQMQKLADEVEYKLKKLIDSSEVKVSKTNKGLEIEIKSNILFSSGQAFLQSKAKTILKDIADTLIGSKNPINVEGFTDNVPINTAVYPSNWELSAARAANVVNLFNSYGIKPIRLSAIGYGEFQPVADNTTATGRKRNRRINVVVLNRFPKKRKRLESLNKNNRSKALQLFIKPNVKKTEDINKEVVTDFTFGGSVIRTPKKPTKPGIILLGSKNKKTPLIKGNAGKKEPTLFSLPPPTMLDK